METLFVSGILKADFDDLVAVLPQYNLVYFDTHLALSEQLFTQLPAACIVHPKSEQPEGSAFIKYLRASSIEGLQKMPVAAIFHEEDNLEKFALQVGANLCVCYPFNETKLLPQIEQLLQASTSKQIQLADFTYLEEISGGDEEFKKEMIATFLRTTKENTDILTNHYQQQQWEEMGKVAHKAKSAYAFLGIGSMQLAATIIEKSCFGEVDPQKIGALLKEIQHKNILLFAEMEAMNT